MLKSHAAGEEKVLLARAERAGISGHNVNKGTAREHFVHDYLETHLPSTLGIGTGEIIGADSKPGDTRNQIDVVIYRRDFPKLVLGGHIEAFLVESVVATIEVKSLLDKDGFEAAAKTAVAVKKLHASRPKNRLPLGGYQPPSVLSLIVAYDGPVNMSTVYGWISPIHEKLGITTPSLPPTMGERTLIPGPSVDGVFVLGKGFLHFDTLPVGFIWDDRRKEWPDRKWVYSDSKDGSLLLLTLLLAMAAGAWLDPVPYLSGWEEDAKFEP